MKSSLSINVGQQYLLTPQLQQAIHLLQLSTFDLHQGIQNQIEINPLLEAISREPKADKLPDDNSIGEEPYDLQWTHLYTPYTFSKKFNEDYFQSEPCYATNLNLKDHLLWQLQLTPITIKDSIIGETIIDAVSDDGFMTISINELFDILKNYNLRVSIEDIEAVRHLIQHFEPLGCATYDLKETMLIQLNNNTPSEYVNITIQIIEENIDLLAKHKYQQLCKIYSISLETLNKIIKIIKSLHPKPGNLFSSVSQEQLIPDLVTKKIGDKWVSELNPYALPIVKINSYYASLIKQAKNVFDVQFLKARLQEANWFIKSIRSRQDTLLRVANYIVSFQNNFFNFGPETMKPLVLKQVAAALDLHESTISRVTTQKYIYTPRGLLELKYFFSRHLATEIGGECSSIALQAVIKKMILEETPQKPLSDNKIAQMILEHGIQIARRTVTKYREKLRIPPAHKRKIFK